jgi:Zn-dependent peptidase ImmA (M78 family)
MEKGERRPRAAELVKLAQLYGRPVGEFVRPVPTTPRPNFVMQFRATRSKTDRAAEREADIRQFEQLCQWYVELEELLNAPLPRRYPDLYDVSATPPERAAEEVASSERNRLGLGDGPIGNLWGILESDVGLRTFALPMRDNRIGGMFVHSEEFGGCIAVNANHPEDRRRWSCAHEYAHFLTDRHRPEITILNIYKRAQESERFAEAFARHFLMPTTGLYRRFESIRRSKHGPITPADLIQLSYLYRVSVQAMTWHLEGLKLLPTGTWDRLLDLGFRPKEAKQLVGFPPHEPELANLPHRYVTLAVQAFLGAHLSEGQLAERLMTDRVGARECVDRVITAAQPVEDGEWQQVALDLTAALVGAS